MKKYFFKVFILVFILSLVINLVISPLRGGYVSIGAVTRFKLSSIGGALIYYVCTYYSLKKTNGKIHSGWILFGIIMGLLFLPLPFRIMDFEGTLVSALEPVIHIIAVCCGYLFYRSGLYLKILTAATCMVCCFCLSTKGYDMWIHKLNFDTFTGKTALSDIPDFMFVNEQSDTLGLVNFSGKYTVVDFWFTGCGICFRKFPKVQALYDKYKDNSLVSVISMNVRLKGESNNVAYETIRKEGYSFPVYRLDMDNSILAELGVNSYPTVLIFDKNSQLIFRGDIENAGKQLENALR
jgi:thiol-disulfide isomerase/thioredoxin